MRLWETENSLVTNGSMPRHQILSQERGWTAFSIRCREKKKQWGLRRCWGRRWLDLWHLSPLDIAFGMVTSVLLPCSAVFLPTLSSFLFSLFSFPYPVSHAMQLRTGSISLGMSWSMQLVAAPAPAPNFLFVAFKIK